jgi:hypothetical protein
VRVHIDARIEVGRGGELLRGHVRRRAEGEPLAGVFVVLVDVPRSAEVEDLRDELASRLAHDHHVRRLEVTMNDPLCVHRRDAFADLREQPDRLLDGPPARAPVAPREVLSERDAVDELHRQQHGVSMQGGLEDPHDVGVIEACGDSHLPQKPRARLRVGEVRGQDHLQRQSPLGEHVPHLVDRAHPTVAEQADHLEGPETGSSSERLLDHCATETILSEPLGSTRRALRRVPQMGYGPPPRGSLPPREVHVVTALHRVTCARDPRGRDSRVPPRRPLHASLVAASRARLYIAALTRTVRPLPARHSTTSRRMPSAAVRSAARAFSNRAVSPRPRSTTAAMQDTARGHLP